MSFQNNTWLPNGSDSVAYDYSNSTRVNHKRAHQWLMGPSEQELFLNKKQAVESVKETAVMENPLWHDGIIFQAEGTASSLFSPKPVQGLNLSDKDMPPIISSSMNMEKKSFENQFSNDPSIGLTMSRSVENPLPLNSGHRKVKVNEVRVSENCLTEFLENNNVMSTTFQGAGNSMFTGPTYNTAVGSSISVEYKNFDSVAQPSSKTDSNFMLPNQYYNGMDNNVLSIGQVFNRGDYNINPVGEQYEKEISNFTSNCPTYSRGNENFFAMDPFYSSKGNETFVSVSPNKGDTTIAFSSQQDATAVSLGAIYNKENSSILSMVDNSEKGEETTISFGGFQNNIEERDHSGRLISSYDFLLNQPAAQSSGAVEQKETTNVISTSSSSKADGASKTKEPKTKKGSNNFPSNVKSLLSTGILDGVPVKYVSWSREKNLRGVVKGTGYMCSCANCKFTKVINAYEFERHAGCKTKHPNNHIYFENGKTIYAVVQELKSTPQDMLFDVMQNITGSSVNLRNFNAWKASYQAATRELRRIYGTDDLIVQS